MSRDRYFRFLGDPSQHPAQLDCFITYTNARTHELIREGIDRSPYVQRFY